MNIFRTLLPHEIDVRVQQVTEKGCSLLLYKDARCDQRILDETVGAYFWQREHSRDNQNCTVSIWSKELNQWIKKEDTGTESNTEKEKGLASDSFKRACFMWGLGVELYSAGFIWVNLEPSELQSSEYQGKKKWSTRVKFEVKEITYDENRDIKDITIVDTKGNVRYSTNKKTQTTTPKPIEPPKRETPTLSEALGEVAIATTSDKVAEIWAKYPQFKKEESFIKAVKEKGESFKTK